MFELEFVDKAGNTIRRTVSSHRLAREVAKDIAKSIGKRVVVRHKKGAWKMLLVDFETKQVVEVGKGYSSENVHAMLRVWDSELENAALVPWPIAKPIAV